MFFPKFCPLRPDFLLFGRIFLFLVGSRALNGRSALNLCAAAGLAALLMAFAFVDYVCVGVFFVCCHFFACLVVSFWLGVCFRFLFGESVLCLFFCLAVSLFLFVAYFLCFLLNFFFWLFLFFSCL